MRAAGAILLNISDNDYADFDSRSDLAPERLGALKRKGIRYERDEDGEFFQIYTHAFEERFFLEIVEQPGYKGFGAPNAGIRLAARMREARPCTMPPMG